MKCRTFSIRHLLLAVGGSSFVAVFMTHAIHEMHAWSKVKTEIGALGGRITRWKEDNGLVSILPKPWRPCLCSLKLKGCVLDVTLLERIDKLGYHVVGLDLTGTTISDTDLAELQALPSYLHLRDLGLAGTNVSIESVQRFEAARPRCVVHGNRLNFKSES